MFIKRSHAKASVRPVKTGVLTSMRFASISFYFTEITRYLLTLQNVCGLVMRSVYWP